MDRWGIHAIRMAGMPVIGVLTRSTVLRQECETKYIGWQKLDCCGRPIGVMPEAEGRHKDWYKRPVSAQ